MDYKMPVNHGESKSGTPRWASGTIPTAPTETEPLTKHSSNASSSSSSSSSPPLSTAWVTAQYLKCCRRHHLLQFCRSLKCRLITIPTSGTQETCETPVESRPSKQLMKTGTQNPAQVNDNRTHSQGALKQKIQMTRARTHSPFEVQY